MRNLWIEKNAEMRADATNGANMLGPWQPRDVTYFTDFLEDTLATDYWATSVPGTSDTIAISVAVGGICQITTGTVDDDSCMLSTELNWEADKKALCEARIRINDVSGTAVFAGFTDAKLESNNSIAIHYAADSETAVATNAAGFVIDADHATSSIMCNGVKAGTLGTAVDSGTDWADAVWHTLRVELDIDGNAVYYLDGNLVGRVANAITDTTDLCFSIQPMTRANDGANTVDVDYVFIWSER